MLDYIDKMAKRIVEWNGTERFFRRWKPPSITWRVSSFSAISRNAVATLARTSMRQYGRLEQDGLAGQAGCFAVVRMYTEMRGHSGRRGNLEFAGGGSGQ